MKYIAAALAALVLLAGCGQSTQEKAASAKASAAAKAKVQRAKCQKQLGPFLKDLSVVDSRLSVGLNVGDLSNLLGQAKVDYDTINFGKVNNQSCLLAGADMETAFNTYTKSLNAWNTCIDDTYCTPPTDSMQNDWAKAGRLIGHAKTKMAKVS